MEKFGKKDYIGRNPDEPYRIAILYQVASYWPAVESFYEACAADRETDVKIFYVADVSVERAQVAGSDRLLREKGIPYTIYSEEGIQTFRPHAALCQPPYDVSYRNPEALSLHLLKMGIRIVYIPYGIEIADTEDARLNHFFPYVVRNCWRLYTFSETMREDYVRYCPNRHAVRALGIPKFDAFYNREIPTDEGIAERAAGRKLVLWKLHFPKLIYEGLERRQVTPCLSEYRKFAEEIEQYDRLFFAVMPHPMFFSQTIDRALAEEAERFFELLAGKNNVCFARDDDYRPVLYHADAIIIDRSALMVEAGLCGVPVLYMKNGEYEEPLTRAVKPLVDAYEQGTCAKDMERFADSFCRDRLRRSAERIAGVQRELLPFVDGRCGERILENIKQGISAHADDVVRIVFFGAGFACRHYIGRLGLLEDPLVHVLGVADNDCKKWGTVQMGIRVIPPETLKELDFDLLVIASEQYSMPIKRQLVYELFLEEEKILRLDVFAERYRTYRRERDEAQKKQTDFKKDKR